MLSICFGTRNNTKTDEKDQPEGGSVGTGRVSGDNVWKVECVRVLIYKGARLRMGPLGPH